MKRLKELGRDIIAISFFALIPLMIIFSPLFIAVFYQNFYYLFLFLITWVPAILISKIGEKLL
jgi:hypothetical protein